MSCLTGQHLRRPIIVKRTEEESSEEDIGTREVMSPASPGAKEQKARPASGASSVRARKSDRAIKCLLLRSWRAVNLRAKVGEEATHAPCGSLNHGL